MSCCLRRWLLLSSVTLTVVLVLTAGLWLHAGPTASDPLTDLRARTAAWSEADLEGKLKAATAPRDRAECAIMLAERLARRDIRGQLDRIAELCAQADQAWAGNVPELRAECALLAARLLSLERRHEIGALQRLRAALADPALPGAARVHGEFGLAFLTDEVDESVGLLHAVATQHPESAYALPAARVGALRALYQGQVQLLLEIEAAVARHPQANADEQRQLAGWLLAAADHWAGLSDLVRMRTGQREHNLERKFAAQAPGVVLALGTATSISVTSDTEFPHPGEAEGVRVVRRWTGPAPADLLSSLAPGRYVVLHALGGDTIGAFWEVSSLGLNVRLDTQAVWCYAANAVTGEPCAGVRLIGELHRSDRADADSAPQSVDLTTDAQGMARLALQTPLAAGADLEIALLAQSPLGAATLRQDLGNSEWPTDGCRVSLYCAKPLYRPGESVEYRLVARVPDGRGGMKVPEGARFVVALQSASGDTLSTETLAVSEFGTATGKVQLASDCSPGLVEAVVEAEGAAFRIINPRWDEWSGQLDEFRQQLFQVEEYRLPDVLLDVTPDRTGYRLPDVLELRITARNAEGGLVANFHGEVSLSASIEDTWGNDRAPRLPFLDATPRTFGGEASWEDTELELPGSACQFQTDASGQAVLRLPLRMKRQTDRVVAVQALVNGADPQGRSASGTAQVLACRAPALVRVAMDEGSWGKPVTHGTVRIESLDGAPIAVPVQVVARRRDWEKNRLEDVGTVSLAAGQTDFTFARLPAGSYEIAATAAVDGVILTETAWWYVHQSGEPGAAGGATLTVRSPRQVYALGDTIEAEAVVPHGVSSVFACIENDVIHAAGVFRADGGVARITFPAAPGAAPNFHLVVIAWQDTVCLQQELTRYIDPGQRLLTVHVEPDAPTARPGTEAAWKVRVVDAAGKPVEAEVSLAVVDERVFTLQEEQIPDPVVAFAPKPRPYRVSAGQVKFWQPGATDDDESDSSGMVGCAFSDEGSAPAIVVREDFRDLAGWHAALRTDANGEVVVRIPYSDSLTEWRATARAASRTGGFGAGRGQAKTRLPVSVRLDVPRLLRVGDVATLSAVVRNQGDAAGRGTVHVSVQGLEAKDLADRPLDLAPGASAVCTWELRATATTEAVIQVNATLGTAADAVVKRLSVLPAGVPVSFAAQGRAAGAEAFAYDGKAVPGGEASMEVTAAPDELMRLLDPLDSLIDYPHGCVEQTMSGFMPAVAAHATLQRLGIRWEKLEQHLPAVTQLAVARLSGFRHEDGGWGWWTHDRTDSFMTTYVLYGLLLARENGVTVPDEMVAPGLDLLESWSLQEEDLELWHFQRLVLATGGRRDAAQEMRKSPGAEPVALAFASRTARRLGQLEEAKRLAALLGATVKREVKGELPYWEGTSGFWAGRELATALVIDVLLEENPADELVGPGLRWLDVQRGVPSYHSTLSNAFATLCAARELAARGVGQGAVRATLTVDGKPVPPEPALAGDPVLRWRLAGIRPVAGTGKIEVRAADATPLRVALRGRFLATHRTQLPPDADGLRVVRALFRLSPGGDPANDDDWQPMPVDGTVAVGERCEVRYRLTSNRTRDRVALVDARPAGMECLLATSGRQETGEYLELRDASVAAFLDELSGDCWIRLPVRFETVGTFAWPPARVFQMYDEDQQAFCDGAVLKVVPIAQAAASAIRIEDLERCAYNGQATELVRVLNRVPASLTEAERVRLLQLVHACRTDVGLWSECGEAALRAVARLVRPDRLEDLATLIDVLGPEQVDDWPEQSTVPDLGFWMIHDVTLARLAIERGNARAWKALGMVHAEFPNTEPVLVAFRRASPEQRAAALERVVAWILEADPAEAGAVFGGAFTITDAIRQEFGTILSDWVARRGRAGTPPDMRLLGVYRWLEAQVHANRQQGKAMPAGLESDWKAAATMLTRMGMEPGELRSAVASLPDRRFMVAVALRRALEDHQPEAYEAAREWLVNTPRGLLVVLAALEAHASVRGRDTWRQLQDLAIDGLLGLVDDEEFVPLSDADASVNAFEQAIAKSRSVVESWLSAREQPGAEPDVRVIELAGWIERVVSPAYAGMAAADRLAWAALRMRAFQRATRPVSMATEAVEMICRVNGVAWRTADLRAWARPHLAAVAERAPATALAILERDCADAEDPTAAAIDVVRNLPAPARLALLDARLAQSLSSRDWVAWGAAFTVDPDPEVRVAALQRFCERSDGRELQAILTRHRDLLLECLRKRSRVAVGIVVRNQLPEALPVLTEMLEQDGEFLWRNLDLLGELRVPGTHALLRALHGRFQDPKQDRQEELAQRAIARTTPVSSTAELQARIASLGPVSFATWGETPWSQEVVALGRWTAPEVVREAMTLTTDEHVLSALARGAAQRGDDAMLDFWLGELRQEGDRHWRALAVLCSAPSRATQEALVAVLTAPEAAGGILSGIPVVVVTGSDPIHPWYPIQSVPELSVLSRNYGNSESLAELAQRALVRFVADLPDASVLEIVQRIRVADTPVLAAEIAGALAARCAQQPALLAAIAPWSEAILAGRQIQPEDPALRAIECVAALAPQPQREFLRAASDRQFVACAGLVLNQRWPELEARLWRLECGTDAVLARHAARVLDARYGAGMLSSRLSLRLPPRPRPPAGDRVPEDPFAAADQPFGLELLSAWFGESPFAPARR